MHARNESGRVEVICGSMFSGKSEELIRRIRRAKYAKQTVQVFKPAIDNRYDKKSVVSHNGNTMIAHPVKTSKDIYEAIDYTVDVVGIDEVQFFDSNIVDLTQVLAEQGITVITAGLDTDFRGEPFGPMPELMARSEYVTKLNAICPVCGSPATRTQRLIDGKPATYHDPVILVGAKESYEPRCRLHHEVPLKPANQFPQQVLSE